MTDNPNRMSAEDLTRMRKWVDAIGDNPYERHTTGADAADRLLNHIAALSADLDKARGLGAHGSPELDADAAKLIAMGADPGPTLEDLEP